jgi:antitoxin HicB
MKPEAVAAIKKQLGLSEIGMRAYPAALTPDPDGGFTVTFRNVPEAITEGDTRDEALLRAEDALESALAMYVAAKEPLPTSSEAAAGEVMVPLSALGMAKNALYDAMREQGVGRAELTRRLRWHLPLVNRVLDLRHASRMEYVEGHWPRAWAAPHRRRGASRIATSSLLQRARRQK